MMLDKGEYLVVRQFDVAGMEAEDIVAMVRGGALEKQHSSNNDPHPLKRALEFFKNPFRRSQHTPVYRAHTVLDTALDFTPGTKDAPARIY